MFDALHQKNEFDHFLNYVSERIILRAIQHKRSQKLNINQDSNVSFDDTHEKAMKTMEINNDENESGLKIMKMEKGLKREEQE